MAGPEQVRAWAGTSRVGRARTPYRGDETDCPGNTEPGASLIRIAWAGRTSTYDQQDPTLSLPRQLRASQMVLPENALIVAHFYDIESGRKDLAARGRGSAHEQFTIPIPRDGGIHDLLAEAERPDRRFDHVICESIDRIARRTYIATDIENRLERAGVRLLAADEPFQLTQAGGRKAKVATQLLTRRVKQGISEFYVVEMLEKSWDGFAVHTEEGFNIGKPCYGYRAKRVPHPVPAKRAKGQKKTFLEPDPLQAPVVKKIFTWRLEERLGYQVIADRLNRDPATNPPPSPVDPERAVGRWTYSNVRDILTNPKHTGHMVWNRHARKTGGNSLNPVSEWIWSSEPVHEVLVSLDTYIQVQEISGHRFGSRSGAGANVKHPHTKRSYLLRTYLFCELCGRRMFGKTRHKHPYYVCAPKKGYIPDGHPAGGTFFVREDLLLDRLSEFLSHHVFGAYRRSLLDASIRTLDLTAQQEREQQVAALRRSIADTEAKIKRTVRNLELVDEPDQDFIRDINERRAELRAQKQQFETRLAEVEERILHAPNPDLIDALPVTKIQVDELPEELARALFEALRLEIHYNKHTNRATCRITLTGQTITAASRTAHTAAVIPLERPRQRHDQQTPNKKGQVTAATSDQPGPILVVPPAGLEPAHECRGRVNWCRGTGTWARPPAGWRGHIAITEVLRGLVGRVAVDPDDRTAVIEGAAVGATKLAWRDSPVEDWHSVSRISNAELFRVNVGTTRLVRDVLLSHLSSHPWPLYGGDETAVIGIQVFTDVADTTSDPARRLPDGRLVVDLTPTQHQFDLFRRHIRVHTRWWTILSIENNLALVLWMLAYVDAARCHHWWLTPGWPTRVAEFIQRLAEPTRWVWQDVIEDVATLRPPPDAAHHNQLYSSSWRARPDGTWGSKSGFSSQKAAENWGNEQEALIRRNMWIDPRDAEPPWGTFAEEWHQAVSPRQSPGTVAKYRSYLDTHLLPQWESWPMIGIFNSYVEIEKWVSELHEEYAESTVASIFAAFSTIMNAAVLARVIPANPCYGIRVTSGAFETEHLIATPVQGLRAAMRLYEAGLGLGGFTLRVVALYTGARWGELVGQQRHEYDEVNKAIGIREPLKEVGAPCPRADGP